MRVSEVERGEYAKPAKTTLAELGQQYMDYAKANKRSWLRDQQILEHLDGAFGKALLEAIWTSVTCAGSLTPHGVLTQ